MKLTEHVYFVGVQNPSLRIFDIIMKTAFGTSYNAYVVKGEKTALVETVHVNYMDEYMELIGEITDVSKIDYVVLNHTEPDHSGSLLVLLERNPDITVIGTAPAIKNLEQIANRTFKSQIIKKREQLDLGCGVVLDFIPAPNLHWPDSMFTYFSKEKILFSCDVFGCHFCEPFVLDKHIKYPEAYQAELLNYYQAIFSPFKKYVLAGLEKLEDCDIQMICPSHGPVLKELAPMVMNSYREWSSVNTGWCKEDKNIAVFYVTAYGYTEKMAKVFEEVFKSAGYHVDSYNILEHDPVVMAEKMNSASAVLFGSPTINRDALKPVWDLISSTEVVGVNNKPALVFGSYGWSGEGCKLLCHRLAGIRYKVFNEGVRCLFSPSDEDIADIRKIASEFIESI